MISYSQFVRMDRWEYCGTFRWSSEAELSWKQKRSYHVQLEILLNTVQAIMGKLLLLILMGASVLSATSSALIILLHNLKSSQLCVYCTYMIPTAFVCLSTLGASMLCKYIENENIAEESDGVLREIEAEIVLKATTGSCVYGRQVVRRFLPARIFRRRVMRIKLGDFKNIETGFTLDFLLQTADNIITFVFMVNAGAESWLF